MTTTCARCGHSFTTRRDGARFCSGRCRVADYRATRERVVGDVTLAAPCTCVHPFGAADDAGGASCARCGHSIGGSRALGAPARKPSRSASHKDGMEKNGVGVQLSLFASPRVSGRWRS